MAEDTDVGADSGALIIGPSGFAWGNSIFTLQVPLYTKGVLCYDIAERGYLVLIAKGFESCTASGYFVNHIDLSPNYAYTMISMTNCVASVVTMLAPIVPGAIIP
uniref:Uncharacterized protein n=1 Tax=Trichogramma kaykai TaxID=54128 RepID=A0ABD2WSL1_9HYME